MADLTVELLTNALAKANECNLSQCATPGAKHQRRSAEWVRCLARTLGELTGESDVCALHKGDDQNRARFGLNELLFDICVCRTGRTNAVRGKSLPYVTRALWIVESEFARDSAAMVKDFNKLVIGDADNKLFVGPRLAEDVESKLLDALLPVAKCADAGGKSRVFVALVPHPDEWGPAQAGIKLYRLAGDNWVPT